MKVGHKIIPNCKTETIRKLRETITNKKSVVAGGCFDLLHFGHLSFIRRSKSLGDVFIILLESDSFIMDHKKKKPVHSQRQRAEILASLLFVDYVLLLPKMKNPDAEYRRIINTLRPSVISYTKGDKLKDKKKELARSVGASFKSIDMVSSFSSSQLITYAPILSG